MRTPWKTTWERTQVAMQVEEQLAPTVILENMARCNNGLSDAKDPKIHAQLYKEYRTYLLNILGLLEVSFSFLDYLDELEWQESTAVELLVARRVRNCKLRDMIRNERKAVEHRYLNNLLKG